MALCASTRGVLDVNIDSGPSKKSASDAGGNDTAAEANSRSTPLTHSAIIGGFVGALLSVAISLAIEFWMESIRPPGPRLSYGQYGGMIIMPLCSTISAVAGFAFGLALRPQRAAATTLLTLDAFVGTGCTFSLWRSYIAVNGRDPSEITLFYPPIILCLVVLSAALVVATSSVFRLLSSPTSPPST